MIKDILEKIELAGFHKVACRMLKEEQGSDYGNPDELDLSKVATVLGQKLAMININRRYFLNGLNQLADLRGEKLAFQYTKSLDAVFPKNQKNKVKWQETPEQQRIAFNQIKKHLTTAHANGELTTEGMEQYTQIKSLPKHTVDEDAIWDPEKFLKKGETAQGVVGVELKEKGVSSPADLSKEEKKEMFNKVDEKVVSKEEKKGAYEIGKKYAESMTEEDIMRTLFKKEHHPTWTYGTYSPEEFFPKEKSTEVNEILANMFLEGLRAKMPHGGGSYESPYSRKYIGEVLKGKSFDDARTERMLSENTVIFPKIHDTKSKKTLIKELQSK